MVGREWLMGLQSTAMPSYGFYVYYSLLSLALKDQVSSQYRHTDGVFHMQNL